MRIRSILACGLILAVTTLILSIRPGWTSTEATGEAAPGQVDHATEIWALELEVADVGNGAGFYAAALGFKVRKSDPSVEWAVLSNGEFRLILTRSRSKAAPQSAARYNLNLSVGDLAEAVGKVTSAGGTADPGRNPSAVGDYIVARDPDGHVIHLIDHPWDEMKLGDPPVVFNVGLNVLLTRDTEEFFELLDVGVSTRDYLPETLVFNRQGMSYFVAHPHAERRTRAAEGAGRLWLRIRDLAGSKARLVAAGVNPRWSRLAPRPGLAACTVRTPSGMPVGLFAEEAGGGAGGQ